MINKTFYTQLSAKTGVRKFANFYLFNCLHFYLRFFLLALALLRQT